MGVARTRRRSPNTCGDVIQNYHPSRAKENEEAYRQEQQEKAKERLLQKAADIERQREEQKQAAETAKQQQEQARILEQQAKEDQEREKKLINEWDAEAKALVEQRKAASAKDREEYAKDRALREKAARDLQNKARFYENNDTFFPNSWYAPKGWSSSPSTLRDQSKLVFNYNFHIDKNGLPAPNDTPEAKALQKKFEEMHKIALISAEQKLLAALENMASKFTGEFKEKLLERIEQLKKPEVMAALLTAAGVIGALQFTPAGPFVNGAAALAGYLLAGAEAVGITKDLYLGLKAALNADTQADIDAAGTHLARGLAKAGVAGVEYVGGQAVAKLAGSALGFVRKVRKELKGPITPETESVLMQRIEKMNLNPEQKKLLIAEVQEAIKRGKAIARNEKAQNSC